MNPVLKNALMYSAKNAVNAALLTLGPIFHDPQDYNFRDLHGLQHVGVLVFWAVVVREGMVWIPKLLKWSQTNGNGENIVKAIILFVAALLFVPFAAGQTPAPQVDTFGVTTSAIALPGSGKTTLAGSMAGMSLKVTPNFNLEQTNFLTSSAQTDAYFGGGGYTLAGLSKKLNNVSPTLAGFDFRFSLHLAGGEARITQTSGLVLTTPAALGYGQVDYAIKGSSTYSLGVIVGDLWANSGLPQKNNFIVALGTTLHFGH